MLDDPTGVRAEPFRVLRTNLEFMKMGGDVRTILVTSAAEQEGKSTTASNLAIGFARQGKNVVLVDLDLRRPSIHRYFGVESTPGLTGVALGHVQLSGALVPFALGSSSLAAPPEAMSAASRLSTPTAFEAAEEDDPWSAPPEEAHHRGAKSAGEKAHQNGGTKATPMSALSVLPAGPIPPDPGEFVASAAVRTILGTLADRADIVIVDSPPLLTVGDALALSSEVDGILVVTQLDLIHRRTLSELHRVLESTPTRKLGFVATGSGLEDDYAYGYGYGQAPGVAKAP